MNKSYWLFEIVACKIQNVSQVYFTCTSLKTCWKMLHRNLKFSEEIHSVWPWEHIQAKLLKQAGDGIISSVVSLFQLSITRKTVFSNWKTARLHSCQSVFKKDDERERGNYRPISVVKYSKQLAWRSSFFLSLTSKQDLRIRGKW